MSILKWITYDGTEATLPPVDKRLRTYLVNRYSYNRYGEQSGMEKYVVEATHVIGFMRDGYKFEWREFDEWMPYPHPKQCEAINSVVDIAAWQEELMQLRIWFEDRDVPEWVEKETVSNVFSDFSYYEIEVKYAMRAALAHLLPAE